MHEIVEKRILAPDVKLFKIKAPEIAAKRKAGQFVVLRVYEKGERFPLTIADADIQKGTITIIVQEIGRSTKELGKKAVGETILDVVGPLGMPTPIKAYGRVVCVAGGVGVAEIYPVAAAMKAAGNEVISIIGARNKQLLIMEDEMKQVSDQLFVTTDDGSYGTHGFVVKPLQRFINEGVQIDHLFCIGPTLMMRAVSELTREPGIETSVSLNSIMVDGTGMCGACRVTVDNKIRFVCVHGPDFNGHQVDYDELLQRQKIYLAEEKVSLDMFRE